MSQHKQDIKDERVSNAMFIHMRDNPGHSFDFKGAKLIYKSNQKSKRQLVESALIATKDNCNLKPGDYPVCRISAPVVLKGVKLDHTDATTIAPTITAPTTTTPTTTTPAAPNPVASSLTQAMDNMDLHSSIPSQISQSYSQPFAPSHIGSTPVAGHTRSRKRKLATIPSNIYQSPSSPDILQSQARANSPKQHLPRQVPPVFSPVNLHQVSPRARENVSHIPLSQTHSPSATTGATRKRKFKCNQVSPLDNNSPMVKRLRSSKLNLVS